MIDISVPNRICPDDSDARTACHCPQSCPRHPGSLPLRRLIKKGALRVSPRRKTKGLLSKKKENPLSAHRQVREFSCFFLIDSRGCPPGGARHTVSGGASPSPFSSITVRSHHPPFGPIIFQPVTFCPSPFSPRSFTTSPAMIRPATDGTKALLPGTCRLCVHFLAVPGGQMQ